MALTATLSTVLPSNCFDQTDRIFFSFQFLFAFVSLLEQMYVIEVDISEDVAPRRVLIVAAKVVRIGVDYHFEWAWNLVMKLFPNKVNPRR